MGRRSKLEYFKVIYLRYHRASRALKRAMLDEFCRVCDYNRKYAIRKLNGPPPEDKPRGKRRQRGRIYDARTMGIIQAVWEAAGYPWSARLKVILQVWMPWLRKRFHLPPGVEKKLRSISARQMDRRLKAKKTQLKKRIYGRTKPGTLLKHHIPIKTDSWNVTTPGFTEVDLVSHSGNSADGEFIHSLNQTDILSTWGTTRAVMGKGRHGVTDALHEMRQELPFDLLGVDSDNGSEFINGHLFSYCQGDPIKKIAPVQFTRGRPYKKDDNAHIEQKNWTHVRKLLGYERYDSPKALDAINDLDRNELPLMMNLFQPSIKLIKKERVGSRLIRKYDVPQTPLDRLIASGKGIPVKVERYKRLRETLDPFELAETIERKLERIYRLANRRLSPKPDVPTLECGQSLINATVLSAAEQDALRSMSKQLKHKGRRASQRSFHA